MTPKPTRHDCGTGIEEPHRNDSKKERPAFLGVAVLARKDHTRPFAIDNCIWRTAVSEDEAQVGREIYVGAELRNRLLELEKQGWIQISNDGRTLLDSAAESGEGATA